MAEVIDDFNSKGYATNGECKEMAGDGRIHDRFIITEKYGWIIGSSFGELGNRVCSIIKMSDAIRLHILRIFEGW